MWKKYVLQLRKSVNIVILFTLEKSLGIAIFYCIVSKRFEKKRGSYP